MARDLGTKYVCFKCGTKFYDFKRPVPTCPKCGADQREAPVTKQVSARARARPPAPREADEPEEAEVAEEEAEEVEEPASADEDV